MNEAILLLGGNLGNREHYLDTAISLLGEYGTILTTSSRYESEAWGFEDKNLFLNQALKIRTLLTPQELMDALLKTESALGRTRTGKLTGRVIDIDILFYGDEKIDTETLTIPHPRIKERLFTLHPLKEIMGEKLLPVLNKTAGALIEACVDKSKIYRHD